MFLMGGATALMGVLPTAAQIGVLADAPIRGGCAVVAATIDAW
jgi:hypothetical protein